MSRNKEKDFDVFMKEKMMEEGLEGPSLNFTNSIISKIEAQNTQLSIPKFRPIISKFSWYLGGAILVSLFSYLIFGNVELYFNWLPLVQVPTIDKFQLIDQLPSMQIPNTYVYAFIGMAFFVMIQVYVLKSHFEKRYFINS